MIRKGLLACVICSFLFPAVQLPAREQGGTPPVYITLWFDTEDYILPQSDDAAKRLAEILTRLEVKGTFKMVGEKARVLERRGRIDVIRALQKHEIGYHTDFHSRQPTVAVYLQNSGWEDGIAEFWSRERPGELDVVRIFRTAPVCYGQPGSSWAPQAYPALRRMGILAYLDEAGHVGLNSQPFYYGGLLNIFNLGKYVTRMELAGGESLTRAKDAFRRTSESLRSAGGGTISIYYHPCEFVHAEFWDGVNFKRGNNPPPDLWKQPPMKPGAAIEKSFQDFEEYIRFLKNEPGVAFKTIAELQQVYADRASGRTFNPSETREIAASTRKEIGYVRSGSIWLSGSETFSLLVEFTKRYLERGSVPSSTGFGFLEGPARSYEPSRGNRAAADISWPAFAAAVLDVSRYCRDHGRVPSEVWMGAYSMSPGDFLATLSAVIEELAGGGLPPQNVTYRTGKVTAERHVTKDSAELWGWIIFPEGFHSPAIMEQARLQAWTLKPAVRQ